MAELKTMYVIKFRHIKTCNQTENRSMVAVKNQTIYILNRVAIATDRCRCGPIKDLFNQVTIDKVMPSHLLSVIKRPNITFIQAKAIETFREIKKYSFTSCWNG